MDKVPRTVRSFKFYYDIVCPFAYMASTIVEGVADRCGAMVNWTPVLLGNLVNESSNVHTFITLYRWFI